MPEDHAFRMGARSGRQGTGRRSAEKSDQKGYGEGIQQTCGILWNSCGPVVLFLVFFVFLKIKNIRVVKSNSMNVNEIRVL